MVGWLIEQEHIRLAPRDQCEGETRAFAAREHIDILEGAVAGKIPAAEEVTELLQARTWRNVAQVVDGRLAFVQRFHCVLGEIAQLHIRMHAALTVEYRQFADQGFDQGRLAGAVRAEQADAVARFEPETDLGQDLDVAVAGVDLVQPSQRIGQLDRIGKVDTDLALGTHRLGAGQLGQTLDSRLRLLGLGRRGLEAVDERLQVSTLDLFLLEGDLLQVQLF